MPSLPPIVCISHLAWERTLFQRPQQIMSRLAARGHDVLYGSKISSKRWMRNALRGRSDLNRGRDGRLHFRNSPWIPMANRVGAIHALDEWTTRRSIRRWLGERAEEAILWLYHPSFISHIERLPRRRLVYDVMDHFRAFKQSKSGVVNQEDLLLEQADVVFTGGRAMHEPIVNRRPDARCFPSGIDRDHFGAAREQSTPIPSDISDLGRPILGYFGAIDERLDQDLIRGVCRAHPMWSVVFLGPVIPGTELSIDESNFHWLGPKPYTELPAYVKGFDVCIMPWAKTELTAHLSPTKTPEYLAGGKPVVSVRIRDVERDYGDVVFFGDTPEEFTIAVEQALAQRDRDWATALEGREAARTWDQIVEEMAGIIESTNL
jgi:UDP-galactopyranose mutase